LTCPSIEVVEVVSATVENDGGLRSPLDIKGDLTLVVDDPEFARIFVHVAPAAEHKSFTFKVQPPEPVGDSLTSFL